MPLHFELVTPERLVRSEEAVAKSAKLVVEA